MVGLSIITCINVVVGLSNVHVLPKSATLKMSTSLKTTFVHAELVEVRTCRYSTLQLFSLAKISEGLYVLLTQEDGTDVCTLYKTFCSIMYFSQQLQVVGFEARDGYCESPIRVRLTTFQGLSSPHFGFSGGEGSDDIR